MTTAPRRSFVLGFLAALGLLAGFLFLSRRAPPASEIEAALPIRAPPGRIAEQEPAADPQPAAHAEQGTAESQVPLNLEPGRKDAGGR